MEQCSINEEQQCYLWKYQRILLKKPVLNSGIIFEYTGYSIEMFVYIYRFELKFIMYLQVKHHLYFNILLLRVMVYIHHGLLDQVGCHFLYGLRIFKNCRSKPTNMELVALFKHAITPYGKRKPYLVSPRRSRLSYFHLFTFSMQAYHPTKWVSGFSQSPFPKNQELSAQIWIVTFFRK